MCAPVLLISVIRYLRYNADICVSKILYRMRLLLTSSMWLCIRSMNMCHTTIRTYFYRYTNTIIQHSYRVLMLVFQYGSNNTVVVHINTFKCHMHIPIKRYRMYCVTISIHLRIVTSVATQYFSAVNAFDTNTCNLPNVSRLTALVYTDIHKILLKPM